MSTKTMEIPKEPIAEQPKEVAPPDLQSHLSMGELKAMASELAKELNELYEKPLGMKAEAELLFKAAGERQAVLLEDFYQKTGVKFQPAFKDKFTVSVII